MEGRDQFVYTFYFKAYFLVEHESTQCQEPMEVNLLEHDESEEDPQSFME
jgi:hypothetical protein